MHREQQNGNVRRIDFLIGRRRRQRLRQRLRRHRDRRLHVLRRGIDVTFEIELDDDGRGAERTLRRHLGDAGDLAELLLERGGDRGRHGLGAGARPGRRDLNGREVDLRQRRYRQERKRDDADKGQSRHHQRGRDRPPDERFGNIHDAFPGVAAVDGAVMVTGALVCSLYWPSVTTRSPSLTPELTMVRSPVVALVWIGRGSTVPSAFTTQANNPRGPRLTASGGMTTTSLRVSTSRRALTNSPGHNFSSAFLNVALRRYVAVVGSIRLSMVVSVPVESRRVLSRS